MLQTRFNYNKVVYLELLNNTIRDYKNKVLIHHYNKIVSVLVARETNPDYYNEFYRVYNTEYLRLVKFYNYYYYKLTF